MPLANHETQRDDLESEDSFRYILHMADMLSIGIIKQFPGRF
ncbi:MAG: hypothetical protein ACRDJV_14330 [Actinomycetota bacterium]